MLGQRFATRINSFASGAAGYWPELTGRPSLAQLVRRASSVDGLTELDLNFPDHFEQDPVEIGKMVAACGLGLSGLAMRYYSRPEFKRGAFTNPDRAIRRAAIDLTKRGIDAARSMVLAGRESGTGADGALLLLPHVREVVIDAGRR